MLNLSCELTDTYGGQANYGWVKRAQAQAPEGASRKCIVHRAKKALGLTGQRCRSFDHGDMIELRPVGYLQVAFIAIG